MREAIENTFMFLLIVALMVLTAMTIIRAWTDSEPTEVIGGLIYKLIS